MSMTAGQQFVKMIKPAGCVIFLGIFVAFLVLCFTPPKEPLPGLEPLHDTEYYIQHPYELYAELEESVFPRIVGIESTTLLDNGRISIEAREDKYDSVKEKITYYYDEELFFFTIAY